MGRIYQSAFEKYGTLVAREKLWRRIVRIYSYHLLLLGFAFSICAAIAAVLFVCRHTAFNVLIGPTLFDALVNQWRLGILRQIDAAAIGILLVKYGSPLAETWLGRRLATLGRASLEVFCAHLVFCFFFLGLASGTDPQYTWPQDAVIIGLTFTGLFAVTHYTQRRRYCPT